MIDKATGSASCHSKRERFRGCEETFAADWPNAGQSGYLSTQGGKLAGKEIELVYRDTGGPNPGGTRALVQELLVKDKVDYLGGFVFTPNAIAVAPLIQQSKTPTVIFNAATSSINEKSDYFIRTSYTHWQVTVPMAQWSAKKGVKRVVTAVTDYGPGIDAENAFKTEFTKQGGTVVESIRMPIATTDCGTTHGPIRMQPSPH